MMLIITPVLALSIFILVRAETLRKLNPGTDTTFRTLPRRQDGDISYVITGSPATYSSGSGGLSGTSVLSYDIEIFVSVDIPSQKGIGPPAPSSPLPNSPLGASTIALLPSTGISNQLPPSTAPMTGSFSSTAPGTWPASSYFTAIATPLCKVQQGPNIDGRSLTCSPDTYCVCASGSAIGEYVTLTGPDACAWTAMPTETWSGPSCNAPSNTAASTTTDTPAASAAPTTLAVSTTSAVPTDTAAAAAAAATTISPPNPYIYTETIQPGSPSNAYPVIEGCPLTTVHSYAGIVTYCLDPTPLSTIIPGTPVPGVTAPFVYTATLPVDDLGLTMKLVGCTQTAVVWGVQTECVGDMTVISTYTVGG
ncbi:hypothetical protein N7G274_000651 [Stereocaulon virgatum]|uniref:Uncharacterized protein n=1 Tax=Stereocaulon virgatum TaxID=373712 RepID=A0ABR4APD6_9LECA